jgi:hypothetical protein
MWFSTAVFFVFIVAAGRMVTGQQVESNVLLTIIFLGYDDQ